MLMFLLPNFVAFLENFDRAIYLSSSININNHNKSMT
jgi:hypothetical protein